MYFDEDYYNEPSEFEKQVDEFKQSLIDVVKDEHKREIQRLREDNARLSAIEREMKEATSKFNNELRSLEMRKQHIKSEVEREFYAANLDDVIKDIIEKTFVWFAESKGHEIEKCCLCNNERKQVTHYPDGTEVSKTCDCAELVYRYEPSLAEMDFIKINKRDSRYQSDRKFYISRSYEPNKESRNSYDDYSYREFKINHVVESFGDEAIKLHEDKSYGEKIGFVNKEECQKYCDWLNNRN